MTFMTVNVISLLILLSICHFRVSFRIDFKRKQLWQIPLIAHNSNVD